jgi:hypothetical protein
MILIFGGAGIFFIFGFNVYSTILVIFFAITFITLLILYHKNKNSGGGKRDIGGIAGVSNLSDVKVIKDPGSVDFYVPIDISRVKGSLPKESIIMQSLLMNVNVTDTKPSLNYITHVLFTPEGFAWIRKKSATRDIYTYTKWTDVLTIHPDFLRVDYNANLKHFQIEVIENGKDFEERKQSQYSMIIYHAVNAAREKLQKITESNKGNKVKLERFINKYQKRLK